MSWPELIAAPGDKDPTAGEASWIAAVTGVDVPAADAAPGCCFATGIGAAGSVTTGVSTWLDVGMVGVAGAGESDAPVAAV